MSMRDFVRQFTEARKFVTEHQEELLAEMKRSEGLREAEDKLRQVAVKMRTEAAMDWCHPSAKKALLSYADEIEKALP